MALTLICSVSVPLSLRDFVITICLPLLLLLAATTTLLQTAAVLQNAYTDKWMPSYPATQQELLWSNSKDFSSLSQWLHRHSGGLANAAPNRSTQNNCWLYPKVKYRTKIQGYYISGFWVSDFHIENFKLRQQRAMGLPKNWIPFFSMLQSNFTLKAMMWYKAQQKMPCSFKYNSLSSIFCKTTPNQRKEKHLQNRTSNGLHFYMLRITS